MRAQERTQGGARKGDSMGVTIRQIAEVAGVSRGTVDRALNNRGRIKPEVAEHIRQIAEEMGYKPNQLGRALSMSKNNIKIGVILQAAETPFMQCVLEGIERAKEEVDSLEEDLRENHMKRLSEMQCNFENGVVFLDAVSNLERISDHAVNIAGYVKEEASWIGYMS